METDAAERAGRRNPARLGRVPGGAILSLGGGLLVWEAVSRLGLASSWLLPAPTAVFVELVSLARSGVFYAHLSATAVRVLLGFGLGGAAGAGIGILCGWRSCARAVLEPWIKATYPLPAMAYIPLLMLALGAGEVLMVAVVALAVFYPVFLSSRTGFDQVDESLVEAARSLGADDRQVLTGVVLPSMVPFLFAGLYQGLMRAVLMTVVVEALIGMRGVGKALWISGEWLKIETYFAYLFTLAVIGSGSGALLRLLFAGLAPWTRVEEGGGNGF